jgi:hypothetical protein
MKPREVLIWVAAGALSLIIIAFGVGLAWAIASTIFSVTVNIASSIINGMTGLLTFILRIVLYVGAIFGGVAILAGIIWGATRLILGALRAILDEVKRVGQTVVDGFRSLRYSLAKSGKEAASDAIGLGVLACFLAFLAYVATEDFEHHDLAISRVFALSGMTVVLFKMLLYFDGLALRRIVWVLLVASIAFPLWYAWASTKGSVVAGTSIVSLWWNEFQGGQFQSNPQVELLNSMVATVWVLVLGFPFTISGWRRFSFNHPGSR